MSVCVFAGSFDPVTKGHQNIIEKIESRFEKVFVVLGDNPEKTPYFTKEERLKLLKKTFELDKKIEVVDYSKISDYAEFLKKNGVTVYVRGIRNDVDKVYEKKYEQINAKLYPFIKTEYVSANNYKEVRSSLIRKKIEVGEDASEYIPSVAKKLYKKIIETKAKK